MEHSYIVLLEGSFKNPHRSSRNVLFRVLNMSTLSPDLPPLLLFLRNKVTVPSTYLKTNCSISFLYLFSILRQIWWYKNICSRVINSLLFITRYKFLNKANYSTYFCYIVEQIEGTAFPDKHLVISWLCCCYSFYHLAVFQATCN